MTKSNKKRKVKKPSSIKSTQSFKGDILRGEYDEEYLKRNGLYERTIKRKARYWCFKMRHSTVDGTKKPDAPKGFVKFIEELPGFAGWQHFAKSWDISGNNPFTIVLRLESVWAEWDHVMNRVAIPIDSPPEQINARMAVLAKEYAKNN